MSQGTDTRADLPEGAERSRRSCLRPILLLLFGVSALCCAAILIFVAINRLAPVTGEADLRRELRDRQNEAQIAWTVLNDLWGRLEAGQAVGCADVVVSRPYFIAWRDVDRATYPALADLADTLNSAIVYLHRAADGWTSVCQSGTAGVSSSAAAAAREALSDASGLLSMVAGALSAE